MTDVAQAALEHLEPLVGLSMSSSHRVADMRVFLFGTPGGVPVKPSGGFALHVQCPWRLETADRIVTGRHDLFRPAEETEDFDWDAWPWDGSETLQDRLVAT